MKFLKALLIFISILFTFQNCTTKDVIVEETAEDVFSKKRNKIFPEEKEVIKGEACSAKYIYKIYFKKGTPKSEKEDLRKRHLDGENECWVQDSPDTELWYIDTHIYSSPGTCPNCVVIESDEDEVLEKVDSEFIHHIKVIVK